jgi:hypothetical protein
MDDRQFDDMTRTVGMQTDRRGLLKAAAGGVLGLVQLSELADRVLAKKCKKDKDCSSSQLCHNKKCVECKSDRDCNKSQKCTSGGRCNNK